MLGWGGGGGAGADPGFFYGGGTFLEDRHFSAKGPFYTFFRRKGPIFSKRALFRYLFNVKADFRPLQTFFESSRILFDFLVEDRLGP